MRHPHSAILLLLLVAACVGPGKGDSDSAVELLQFVQPSENGIVDGTVPTLIEVVALYPNPHEPERIGFASNLGPLTPPEAEADSSRHASISAQLTPGTWELQAGTLNRDDVAYYTSIPVRLDFEAPVVQLDRPAHHTADPTDQVLGRVSDDAANGAELTLDVTLDGAALLATADATGNLSATLPTTLAVGWHDASVTVTDTLGRAASSEVSWVRPGDFVASPLGPVCELDLSFATTLGDSRALVTWWNEAGELVIPPVPGDAAMTGTLPPGPQNLYVTADWGLGMWIDQHVSVDVLASPTWYEDHDGDGFGSELSAVVSCTAPPGFVADAGDCDDDDDTINPSSSGEPPVWYPDPDGDGWGDLNLPGEAWCWQPANYADRGGDCDETSFFVNPGASEVCDTRDQNCDGLIDNNPVDGEIGYPDSDLDGYGDAFSPTHYCDTRPASLLTDSADCDDADPGIRPDASETCDGVDEDCDGLVDNDATDYSIWYADDDSDGYGDPADTTVACTPPAGMVRDASDCDDLEAESNPSGVEVCGGGDEDCDGETDEDSALDAMIWYADADGDGYGDAAEATRACVAPADHVSLSGDCDDQVADVNGSVAESCNGVDDDCDGGVDESGAIGELAWYLDADGDTFGDPRFLLFDCEQPTGYVESDTDCDDTNADVYPGQLEFCNTVDDNCDGAIDEADAVDQLLWSADLDGDTFGDPATTALSCWGNPGDVEDATDCDDSRADVSPLGTELCGGADEDCDGEESEDSSLDAILWYADSDGDTYGSTTAAAVRACEPPLVSDVVRAGDCDDTDETAHLGAVEACDGADDDCDGTVDNLVDRIHGANADAASAWRLPAMMDWAGVSPQTWSEDGLLSLGETDWYRMDGRSMRYRADYGGDDLVVRVSADEVPAGLVLTLFGPTAATVVATSAVSGPIEVSYGEVPAGESIVTDWWISVSVPSDTCLDAYTLELSIGG